MKQYMVPHTEKFNFRRLANVLVQFTEDDNEEEAAKRASSALRKLIFIKDDVFKYTNHIDEIAHLTKEEMPRQLYDAIVVYMEECIDEINTLYDFLKSHGYDPDELLSLAGKIEVE